MSLPQTVVWLVLATAVAACGPASPPAPRQYVWTEDVMLDVGLVQVRRVVSVIERNSMSGDAYNAVETNSRIEFIGEQASLPPWSEALRPLVLYRDESAGEWVVVASTTSCKVWSQRGEPAAPYWEYRLRHGGWVETSLSATSVGRATNLAQKFARMAEARHVTPALRTQLDASANRLKTYRGIYPKPDGFCGTPNSSH